MKKKPLIILVAVVLGVLGAVFAAISFLGTKSPSPSQEIEQSETDNLKNPNDEPGFHGQAQPGEPPLGNPELGSPDSLENAPPGVGGQEMEPPPPVLNDEFIPPPAQDDIPPDMEIMPPDIFEQSPDEGEEI